MQLHLGDNQDDSKDKLTWRFSRGPALDQSDFGNPLASAHYALCIYDDSMLKLAAYILPSASYWKASRTGYLLIDSEGTNDGVFRAQLKAARAGLSRLLVKGKGENLSLPSPVSGTKFFNSATAVTAQFVEANGDCYETVFAAADIRRNDGTQFRARH